MSATGGGTGRGEDLTDGRGVVASVRRSGAWTGAAAAAVVTLGAILAIPALARPPWLDETITLRIVGSLDWAGWLTAFGIDNQPPAYHLLLTAWARIGDALPWLRVCSLVCGLGTLALAMRWTGAISRGTAPMAGLLLATSPVLLRYSVELRPYALLLLSTAWAGYTAATWAQRPARRTSRQVALGLALALAALTHFVGAFLVPAIGAYVLTTVRLSRPRPAWRECVGRLPWLALTSALGLAAGALVLKGAPVVRSPGDWWMPPLDWPLAVTTTGELLGLAASGSLPASPLAVAAVLLALAIVFTAARSSASHWLPPLVAAIVYWLTVAALSLAWLPIWWPRILAPGLLPLAVAVAIAVRGMPRRASRVGLVALVLLTAVAAAGRWIVRDAGTPVENWPAAFTDLTAADSHGPVFCLPGYTSLALESALGIDPVRLRRLDPGQTPEAIDDEVGAALSAAAPAATVGLAIRVDLTLARDPDVVDRVARALRDLAGGPNRVSVGLITSPDASLVPSLADLAQTVEATLTAVLGQPIARDEHVRALRLVFERPSPPR